MSAFGKNYFGDMSLPIGAGKSGDRTLGEKMLTSIGDVSSFRTRQTTLPDGRVMMVRTKGGMPEITINDLAPQKIETAYYMTSGAYNTGVYNIAQPELTPDFVTHKSSVVQTIDDTAFLGVIKKARPMDGEVSKLYTQAKLGAATLTTASLAVTITQPSQFTGLARRMVQGRYGIGNYSPSVGGVMMDSYFGATTGVVYFAEVRQYWIVKLEQETTTLIVKVAKLKLDKTLENALNKKRDFGGSANEIAAVETLALAYAKPVLIEGVMTTIASVNMPDGEPIAHGWNFSLSSNMADCVVRQWAGYVYDRHHYHHLRLTFTFNTDKPSVVMSTVESVDGWLYSARSPIWIPFGSATKWLNKFTNPDTPTSSQNCPVYAFYDDDDLKVVRWAYSGSTIAFDSTERDAIKKAAEFSAAYYGAGSCAWSWEYEYGTQETFGFSIGGVTNVKTSSEHVEMGKGEMVGTYDSTPGTPPTPLFYAFSTTTYANNVFNPGCQATDINPQVQLQPPVFANGDYYYPRTGNHYSTWEVTSATVVTHSEAGTLSKSHMTPLVIAVNDPCTVYLAAKVDQGGIRSIVDSTGNMGNARVDEWFGTFDGNNVYYLVGPWIAPVAKQVSPAIIQTITAPITTSTVEDAPVLSYQITVNSKGAGATVFNGDSLIFHPGPENEFLPLPIAAISSSMFGDTKYTNGNLQSDTFSTTSGYPDTITIFVGAS